MTGTLRAIPVVIAAAFLTGAVLRIVSGTSLFSADMVYKSPGEIAFPGTKTPEDTAVSFFMYIDRGLYEKAFDISIEPDYYPAQGPALFKVTLEADPDAFQGITGKDEFIKRLNLELGPKGLWIKLHNITGVVLEEKYDPPEWINNGNSGRLVKVTGHILGACTIFSWEKVIPVVQTDKGFKVLLPGTKQARQFYYQDWIMNIIKLFDLRATDAESISTETVEL